jgi:hypothetical protein
MLRALFTSLSPEAATAGTWHQHFLCKPFLEFLWCDDNFSLLHSTPLSKRECRIFPPPALTLGGGVAGAAAVAAVAAGVGGVPVADAAEPPAATDAGGGGGEGGCVGVGVGGEGLEGFKRVC